MLTIQNGRTGTFQRVNRCTRNTQNEQERARVERCLDENDVAVTGVHLSAFIDEGVSQGYPLLTRIICKVP